MRQLDEVIISCAVTGAIHTPSMSPHLPYTPEELIEEGVGAAEAGASIIHIHVRDPETGEPTSDLELFRKVAEGIKAECDAIIQPTTGGAVTMSTEERAAVVPELEPEMASCNMGSMNFGLYPINQTIDEYEYDWEEPYLESTRDVIFPNTFADIEELIPMFQEVGTKPELECYDIGHLYNAAHFVDRGIIDTPIHLQFVMGIHGGIAAEPEHLVHMKSVADKLFTDDYSFSVIGAGRNQFARGCEAISMGGHVRVGMEDNLYLRRGELAKSNAQQVEKIANLAWEVAGRKPADPETTREFLGLKGLDEVAF